MGVNRCLCIAGKNQIAIDVLDEALARDRWRVVALPNAGDDGTDGWQPSFRRVASERGVELVDLGWAAGHPHLVFLSVEFDRIIRPAAFAGKRLFNVHFSLLPRNRGCFTSIWPILEGEKRHGVSLHWIDPGIDTGPIIDQRGFEIGDSTARDLYFRCMAEGTGLATDWLERLVEGVVPAIPQDDSEASTYRRADLDFRRGDINFGLSVQTALKTVRAFYFPQYQTARLGGRPILRAEPSVGAPAAPRGTLEVHGKTSARVWLADGAIDLWFGDHTN